MKVVRTTSDHLGQARRAVFKYWIGQPRTTSAQRGWSPAAGAAARPGPVDDGARVDAARLSPADPPIGQVTASFRFLYDEALVVRTNSAVTLAARISGYDRFIAREDHEPSMEKERPSPNGHASSDRDSGSSDPKPEHNVLVPIPYSNASPPSMPTASRRQPKA